MAIQLEHRIARTHIGPGMIERPPGAQPHNPYWSYVRHLPMDWDHGKKERRTGVAKRLLENLSIAGPAMDLSPLKDDQRASGEVFGVNPLQAMLDITVRLSEEFPAYPFFGKWGGYEPWREGKRFVFYVEDKNDAAVLSSRVARIASGLGVPLTIAHQYGLTTYQEHVKIMDGLRSEVEDREGFRRKLEELVGFPHFFHEFFE